MSVALLVENSWWRQGPFSWLSLVAWKMGFLTPGHVAHQLVKGAVSFSLLQSIVLDPSEQSRAKVVKLLAILPHILPAEPLSVRGITGLVFLFDYLPEALVQERDACLAQLGDRHPSVVYSILSCLPTHGGFSLVGPLIVARTSQHEQDVDQLPAFQSELFKQLRVHLRDDPHWDRETRRTLFIKAGVVFVTQVGPALKILLDRRGLPRDLATLRLLVFCRQQLGHVLVQVREKGVWGNEWEHGYESFMEWSAAYLARARLSSASQMDSEVSSPSPGRKM